MKIRFAWIVLLVWTASPAHAGNWKIFCIPEKHLDVGWSYLPSDALDQGYPGSAEDYQNFSTLRAVFVRERTADYPPEAQYRWYFDAAWQLEKAQRFMPRLFQDIHRLVNEGIFSYNPVHANLHSMYLTHEQMMQMMDYGRRLEQSGFRRSVVASQTDVPTVGWGFASALASAGIKYFIKGTWYKGPYSRDLSWIDPAPLFRWVGPDGKKVLFFYHDNYSVMADGRHFGEPLSEATVEKYIRKYESLRAQGKWPYDAFLMFASEGDWGIPDRDNSDFMREWNRSHPSVALKLATPEEFFDYIETHFANQVPDGVQGGWGISYDLIEANAVKPGAHARAGDHLLLAAETFSALSAVHGWMSYPTDVFYRAWLNLVLYHEHSFGMLDGPGPDGRRQYA